MKRISTVYIIQDNIKKSQLVEAIKNFEDRFKTNVLKVFVNDNHLIITEFDKISVNQWYIEDVQEFILYGFNTTKSDILDTM